MAFKPEISKMGNFENLKDGDEIYYKSLIHGTCEERIQAIKALSSDKRIKAKILDKLYNIIKKYSEILYWPTPDGLKQDELKKYQKIREAATIEQAAISTLLNILGPNGLLDNERFVQAIDASGMLERLNSWQYHITTMQERAFKTAEIFKEKHKGKRIDKIKIFGVGGSSAPYDIAREVINNSRKSSTEIEIIRAESPNPDYIDKNTLCIFCSFSGNTEETIHSYKTVKYKTSLIIIITKNGELSDIAIKEEIPFIQLPEHKNEIAYVIQPRESVCLQLTAILTFLAKVGLKPGSDGKFAEEDILAEFKEASALIRKWRDRFGPQVPFNDNLAKQYALFLLYGIDHCKEKDLKNLDIWKKKVPFVITDRNIRAIGWELVTQINERSKLCCCFYEAPECLHNLVESIRATVEASKAGLYDLRFVYLFIRSVDEEERIQLRLDKTIELVLKNKCKYKILNIEGKSPYQRALYATYFNAHMTTYLAILNGYDPLPVPTMSWIKNVMKGITNNQH